MQVTGLVEDEGAAQGAATSFVKDSEVSSHRTMRPEVAEQREGVTLLLGEDAQRRRRIAGDSQELDIVVLKRADVVAQVAELPVRCP